MTNQEMEIEDVGSAGREIFPGAGWGNIGDEEYNAGVFRSCHCHPPGDGSLQRW